MALESLLLCELMLLARTGFISLCVDSCHLSRVLICVSCSGTFTSDQGSWPLSPWQSFIVLSGFSLFLSPDWAYLGLGFLSFLTITQFIGEAWIGISWWSVSFPEQSRNGCTFPIFFLSINFMFRILLTRIIPSSSRLCFFSLPFFTPPPLFSPFFPFPASNYLLQISI